MGMGGRTGQFSQWPANLELPDRKHRTSDAGRITGLLGAILLIALVTAIMWITGCAGLTSGTAQSQTPTPTSLAITTSNLPAGQTGAAYQAALAASGGTTPYSWTLASGALPVGLSLNSTSGAISGMASASGTSAFSAKVTDASGKSAQQSLSIAIAAVSSGPLSVANALLAGGQVGQMYVVTLQAAGGTPSYSWSITSGQLPAGLTLAATSGQISGTPTVSGQSSITVSVKDSSASAQTATKPLTITIATPTTDQYGGLLAKLSPSGGTGHWRTEKFGNHWLFVTPEGHGFFSTGVFGVVPTSNAIAKYGDQDITWGPQIVRRLQSWGFNTILDHSQGWVYPQQTCGGCAGWQNGQPQKMAAVWFIDGSSYPIRNVNNLAPASAKDVFQGVNKAYYNGYVAPSTDPYDPNFSAWIKGYMATSEAATAGNSPWIMGFSLGESDYTFGFGAGSSSTFGTVPAGHNGPHLAWIVLVTSPTQTSNSMWSVNYTDTKVYAKYALHDFLVTRYGTIAALNTAWASTYTTFDTAGGWGAGTGLLDEDGRHAWVGNWDTLAGETSAMQTDLNDFLFQYASQWFKTQHDAVKAVFPNMMYFGPNVVGSWGAPPRKEILQAAALYIDVFMTQIGTGATDDQQRLDYTMQYLGDKPIATWLGFPANPDSALSATPNPPTFLATSTQATRGQEYTQMMTFFMNATVSSTVSGAAGSQPFVGMRWWALGDSSAEKTNWGLVSLTDNAYNGVEAVIALGIDPWGYKTGGEGGNYGNFLSPVISANQLPAAIP